MDNGNNTNILKVRDDRDCIKLIWHEAEDKAESKFTIDATYKPDWCSGDTCTKSELRSRIEPWLPRRRNVKRLLISWSCF